MSFFNFIQTKTFKTALITLACFIAALLIFQAGMYVGFRKAEFSYHFGDSYYRTFGGGPAGGNRFPPDDLMGSHGAQGTIVKIALPTFVIEGPDNIEKAVVIKEDTIFRRFRDSATSTDLKEGDSVIVLGSPNDQGQIEAKLVRIVPPAEGGVASSTAPRSSI